MAGVATRWIKLDIGFPTHPKARAAGRDGRSLHIVALCHCAQNLSDGFITTASLPVLCSIAEVKAQTVDRLVASGLWIEVAGGWQIHDYLDFQQSRATVVADREAAKERMRARRSGGVRTNNARSSDEVRQQDKDEEREVLKGDLDTGPTDINGGGLSRLVQDALTLAVNAEIAGRDINRPIENFDRWAIGYRTNKLTERRAELQAWLDRHPNGTARQLAIDVFGASPLYVPFDEAAS